MVLGGGTGARPGGRLELVAVPHTDYLVLGRPHPHIYVDVYTYTHKHVSMYVCVCVCVCMYVFMYVSICGDGSVFLRPPEFTVHLFNTFPFGISSWGGGRVFSCCVFVGDWVCG